MFPLEIWQIIFDYCDFKTQMILLKISKTVRSKLKLTDLFNNSKTHLLTDEILKQEIFRNVKQLNIANNPTITDLSVLNYLTKLDISDSCNVEQKHLRKLNLVELNLKNNKHITDYFNSKLLKLNISGKSVFSEHALINLTQLTCLIMRYHKFHTINLLQELEELDARFCYLSDLSSLTKLTKINISNNICPPKDLTKLTSLLELRMDYGYVNATIDLINLVKLTSLKMRDTFIRPVNITTTLLKLDITHNETISQETINKLINLKTLIGKKN